MPLLPCSTVPELQKQHLCSLIIFFPNAFSPLPMAFICLNTWELIFWRFLRKVSILSQKLLSKKSKHQYPCLIPYLRAMPHHNNKSKQAQDQCKNHRQTFISIPEISDTGLVYSDSNCDDSDDSGASSDESISALCKLYAKCIRKPLGTKKVSCKVYNHKRGTYIDAGCNCSEMGSTSSVHKRLMSHKISKESLPQSSHQGLLISQYVHHLKAFL